MIVYMYIYIYVYVCVCVCVCVCMYKTWSTSVDWCDTDISIWQLIRRANQETKSSSISLAPRFVSKNPNIQLKSFDTKNCSKLNNEERLASTLILKKENIGKIPPEIQSEFRQSDRIWVEEGR